MDPIYGNGLIVNIVTKQLKPCNYSRILFFKRRKQKILWVKNIAVVRYATLNWLVDNTQEGRSNEYDFYGLAISYYVQV